MLPVSKIFVGGAPVVVDEFEKMFPLGFCAVIGVRLNPVEELPSFGVFKVAVIDDRGYWPVTTPAGPSRPRFVAKVDHPS